MEKEFNLDPIHETLLRDPKCYYKDEGYCVVYYFDDNFFEKLAGDKLTKS